MITASNMTASLGLRGALLSIALLAVLLFT